MRRTTGQGRRFAGIASVALTVASLSALGAAPVASAAIADKPIRTWGVGPATVTSASVGKPRVLAILPVGDRVYVAGTFDSVLDTSGVSYPVKNVAVFSASTGQADLDFAASTNATVTALASDSSRLYLGGTFGTVNGSPRRGLAAVDLTTGALDPTWDPGITDTGQVDALTVTGGWVYLGGNFTSITGSTGTSQSYLAKVSTSTGAVDTAWTPTPNDRVRSVNVAADGTGRLFVGGDFSSVSGRSGTTRLAAVALDTVGAVDIGFRASGTNQGASAPVYDVTSDATRVYVGVAGSGGACAALNESTGALVWSDHSNGNLQGVRLSGSLLYCGGHFSGTASFAGVNREKLAAVDRATGTPTAFAPNINSSQGTWSLGADSGHVYVGGDFSAISGVPQPHFAMFVDSVPATTPSAPGNLLAQPGDAVVHLSWSAPSTDGGSPLQKYKVYRAATPGGQNFSRAPLATLSKDVRSYDDTAVTNGATYYYVVVATNAVGPSAPSGEASATPNSSTTITPPQPPTSVTATSPSGYVHLQWNPPSDNGGAPVTSYRVYRAVSAGGEDLNTPIGTSTTTSFDNLYGLTAGTTYYYVVTAVNTAGESGVSAESSVTATPGPPGPAVLSGTVVAGPAVRLDWTPAPDGGSPITKYVVLRDAVRIGSVTGATASTYTDRSVTAGATYTYQVRAVNANGNGQLSNKVDITP